MYEIILVGMLFFLHLNTVMIDFFQDQLAIVFLQIHSSCYAAGSQIGLTLKYFTLIKKFNPSEFINKPY